MDPQMSGKTRFGSILARFQTPLMGLSRERLEVVGSLTSE